jgi:hypothetical protein
MEIKIDTKKLANIAEKSSNAKLRAKLEKERTKQQKEYETKCRLKAEAKKRFNEIIFSIPDALENAATNGFIDDRGRWNIHCEILLASATSDSLYGGRYNRHFSDKEKYLIEEFFSSYHEINQNNQGLHIRFTESTEPKHSNPTVGVDSDYITHYFIEVNLLIPSI